MCRPSMVTPHKQAEGPVVEDESLAYDSSTAPVAVHEPGVGKEAQHSNTHLLAGGSTVKHDRHTCAHRQSRFCHLRL